VLKQSNKIIKRRFIEDLTSYLEQNNLEFSSFVSIEKVQELLTELGFLNPSSAYDKELSKEFYNMLLPASHEQVFVYNLRKTLLAL
jgi:hypothetical protein